MIWARIRLVWYEIDVYQTGRRDRPMAPNMHHFFEPNIWEKRPKTKLKRTVFFLDVRIFNRFNYVKAKESGSFYALGKTGDIFSVWYTIAKSRREATRWPVITRGWVPVFTDKLAFRERVQECRSHHNTHHSTDMPTSWTGNEEAL
jgi:hypothetical protein